MPLLLRGLACVHREHESAHMCVCVCVWTYLLDLVWARKSWCTQRMKGWRSEWEGGRWLTCDSSRVAEAPAEIVFCDGKQGVVADSPGYPVHVGPRLGPETGVEIVRNAAGTGDPGRVTTDSDRRRMWHQFRPAKLGRYPTGSLTCAAMCWRLTESNEMRTYGQNTERNHDLVTQHIPDLFVELHSTWMYHESQDIDIFSKCLKSKFVKRLNFWIYQCSTYFNICTLTLTSQSTNTHHVRI